MYSEFAFSRTMQLILAGISLSTAFIFIYLIANLILRLYGEVATTKQKSIFALLVGVLLDSGWVYLVYFIGGMRSFSSTVYLLVVTANPIFALLYFFLGVRIFKLSPLRSIKLMGHVYLYFNTIKALSRIIESVFFIQQGERYNYMLDAFSRMAFLMVFLGIYWLTRHILMRDKRVIEMRDSTYIELPKEISLFFVKATSIYVFSVAVPMLVDDAIAANVFVFAFFSMSLALTLMVDIYGALKSRNENNLAHINILSRELTVEHKGGILELSKRVSENPSLASILLSKLDYAEKMNVKMSIGIQSRLDDMYIDNVDACTIVACLLDNAIEAAADSAEKIVSVAIESKTEAEKLIIINNSTAVPVDTDQILYHGITAMDQRSEDGGIATVRSIASKHGNCTFHLSYYHYVVTAYLSMRRI